MWGGLGREGLELNGRYAQQWSWMGGAEIKWEVCTAMVLGVRQGWSLAQGSITCDYEANWSHRSQSSPTGEVSSGDPACDDVDDDYDDDDDD